MPQNDICKIFQKRKLRACFMYKTINKKTNFIYSNTELQAHTECGGVKHVCRYM